LSDFSACAEQKEKNQERSMKEKKKAENSRHQSIDLKKCLSLQFFSLSPSLSLNLKEKNHSDTQEEKNKIELCRLFLLIFKKKKKPYANTQSK
jgi:hypothetical protein